METEALVGVSEEFSGVSFMAKEVKETIKILKVDLDRAATKI